MVTVKEEPMYTSYKAKQEDSVAIANPTVAPEEAKDVEPRPLGTPPELELQKLADADVEENSNTSSEGSDSEEIMNDFRQKISSMNKKELKAVMAIMNTVTSPTSEDVRPLKQEDVSKEPKIVLEPNKDDKNFVESLREPPDDSKSDGIGENPDDGFHTPPETVRSFAENTDALGTPEMWINPNIDWSEFPEFDESPSIATSACEKSVKTAGSSNQENLEVVKNASGAREQSSNLVSNNAESSKMLEVSSHAASSQPDAPSAVKPTSDMVSEDMNAAMRLELSNSALASRETPKVPNATSEETSAGSMRVETVKKLETVAQKPSVTPVAAEKLTALTIEIPESSNVPDVNSRQSTAASRQEDAPSAVKTLVPEDRNATKTPSVSCNVSSAPIASNSAVARQAPPKVPEVRSQNVPGVSRAKSVIYRTASDATPIDVIDARTQHFFSVIDFGARQSEVPYRNAQNVQMTMARSAISARGNRERTRMPEVRNQRGPGVTAPESSSNGTPDALVSSKLLEVKCEERSNASKIEEQMQETQKPSNSTPPDVTSSKDNSHNNQPSSKSENIVQDSTPTIQKTSAVPESMYTSSTSKTESKESAETGQALQHCGEVSQTPPDTVRSAPEATDAQLPSNLGSESGETSRMADIGSHGSAGASNSEMTRLNPEESIPMSADASNTEVSSENGQQSILKDIEPSKTAGSGSQESAAASTSTEIAKDHEKMVKAATKSSGNGHQSKKAVENGQETQEMGQKPTGMFQIALEAMENGHEPMNAVVDTSNVEENDHSIAEMIQSLSKTLENGHESTDGDHMVSGVVKVATESMKNGQSSSENGQESVETAGNAQKLAEDGLKSVGNTLESTEDGNTISGAVRVDAELLGNGQSSSNVFQIAPNASETSQESVEEVGNAQKSSEDVHMASRTVQIAANSTENGQITSEVVGTASKLLENGSKSVKTVGRSLESRGNGQIASNSIQVATESKENAQITPEDAHIPSETVQFAGEPRENGQSTSVEQSIAQESMKIDPEAAEPVQNGLNSTHESSETHHTDSVLNERVNGSTKTDQIAPEPIKTVIEPSEAVKTAPNLIENGQGSSNAVQIAPVSKEVNHQALEPSQDASGLKESAEGSSQAAQHPSLSMENDQKRSNSVQRTLEVNHQPSDTVEIESEAQTNVHDPLETVQAATVLNESVNGTIKTDQIAPEPINIVIEPSETVKTSPKRNYQYSPYSIPISQESLLSCQKILEVFDNALKQVESTPNTEVTMESVLREMAPEFKETKQNEHLPSSSVHVYTDCLATIPESPEDSPERNGRNTAELIRIAQLSMNDKRTFESGPITVLTMANDLKLFDLIDNTPNTKYTYQTLSTLLTEYPESSTPESPKGVMPDDIAAMCEAFNPGICGWKKALDIPDSSIQKEFYMLQSVDGGPRKAPRQVYSSTISEDLQKLFDETVPTIPVWSNPELYHGDSLFESLYDCLKPEQFNTLIQNFVVGFPDHTPTETRQERKERMKELKKISEMKGKGKADESLEMMGPQNYELTDFPRISRHEMSNHWVELEDRLTSWRVVINKDFHLSANVNHVENPAGFTYFIVDNISLEYFSGIMKSCKSENERVSKTNRYFRKLTDWVKVFDANLYLRAMPSAVVVGTQDAPRVFMEEVLEMIQIVRARQGEPLSLNDEKFKKLSEQWMNPPGGKSYQTISVKELRSVFEEFNCNKALVTIVEDPIYINTSELFHERGGYIRTVTHDLVEVFDSAMAATFLFDSLVRGVNWHRITSCNGHLVENDEKSCFEMFGIVIREELKYIMSKSTHYFSKAHLDAAVKAIKAHCPTTYAPTKPVVDHFFVPRPSYSSIDISLYLYATFHYQLHYFVNQQTVEEINMYVWLARLFLGMGWLNQFFHLRSDLDIRRFLGNALLFAVPKEMWSPICELMGNVVYRTVVGSLNYPNILDLPEYVPVLSASAPPPPPPPQPIKKEKQSMRRKKHQERRKLAKQAMKSLNKPAEATVTHEVQTSQNTKYEQMLDNFKNNYEKKMLEVRINGLPISPSFFDDVTSDEKVSMGKSIWSENYESDFENYSECSMSEYLDSEDVKEKSPEDVVWDAEKEAYEKTYSEDDMSYDELKERYEELLPEMTQLMAKVALMDGICEHHKNTAKTEISILCYDLIEQRDKDDRKIIQLQLENEDLKKDIKYKDEFIKQLIEKLTTHTCSGKTDE